MRKGSSKTKYAITIEVDFYGDQENIVVKKGGKVYIYPVEDNPDLFGKLKSRLEGEPGVKIKDKREQSRLTVNSQIETLTKEEYDMMHGFTFAGRSDDWGFRWS